MEPVVVYSVLVVDDDPPILELLAMAAEREPDFRVVGTTTLSSEVLDLVRTERPDVVILDHGLGDEAQPIVDLRDGHRRGRGQLGLELVELMHELDPKMTIVIFTGWPGLQAAAKNVGADIIIEKPAVADIWPAIRKARAPRTADTQTLGR